MCKVAEVWDAMEFEERVRLAGKFLNARKRQDIERNNYIYANWIGVQANVKRKIYPYILEQIENEQIAEKVSQRKETDLRVRLVDNIGKSAL